MLNKNSKPGKAIVIISGFIVLGIFLVFLFGYLVMLLWNWLMPDIFNLPEVTYWQALGILLLAKLLFGFGGGGHGGKNCSHGGNRKGRSDKANDRQMKEKFKKWLESQEQEPNGEHTEEKS